MTRPHDWYPLAETDPVPGDPVKVTAAETHYRDIANRIRSAAANLLSVMNAANDTSDAVAAFRDKAADVRIGILKAETRYEGLADALGAYAPLLAAAQSKSVVALRNAQEAHGEAWSARNNEAYLQDRIRQTIDPFEAAELSRDVGFQRSRAEQADADLASARSLLDQAITERDDAAKAAIQQIDDVEAVSPVRDQWHDKVRDWARTAAENIMAAVEAIGQVLDKITWIVLAIQVVLVIALFIPGVGVFAAAALAVAAGVAKVLTAISLVVAGATALAITIQMSTGKRSLESGLTKLASIGAILILKKVLGKASSRYFHGAADKLELSEKMRFVRWGAKNPAGRAEAWASGALGKESVQSLSQVFGTSTDFGRDAIQRGVGGMVTTDAVEGFAGKGIESSTEFVIEQVERRELDKVSQPPFVPSRAGLMGAE